MFPKILPVRWVSRLKKYSFLRTMNLYRVFLKNNLYLSRLKTPSVLFIFITSRCNARCQHCFYWKQLESKEDMRLEDYKKIISSLKNRLSILILTGGEPTLHPQLASCIEFALKENNPQIIAIPTNGILVENIAELADFFCQKYPKTLFDFSFSLDGNKNTHDKIRGVEGCFEKTVASINRLKKLKAEKKLQNLGINIVTTVGEHNVRQLDELFFYVKNHLDVNHKIQLLRGSSTGVFGVDRQQVSGLDPRISTDFSEETLRDLRATISRVQRTYEALPLQKLKLSEQLDTLEGRPSQMKCVAGVNDGVIYQNGDVAVCEMLKPIGNLKDFHYDFSALWNSKKVRNYTEKLHCRCVHNCNLVSNMKYDFRSLKKLWGLDKKTKPFDDLL